MNHTSLSLYINNGCLHLPTSLSVYWLCIHFESQTFLGRSFLEIPPLIILLANALLVVNVLSLQKSENVSTSLSYRKDVFLGTQF